jgi:hypothetical protein
MKKEIKYQVIVVALFLVAICIAIIARRGPQPTSLFSPEVNFQIGMGMLFGLFMFTSLFLAGTRMYILYMNKQGYTYKPKEG